MFYSCSNRPVTVASPGGERFAPIYREVTENGGVRLELIGQHDLYEMIQANTEFADLRCIMARFQRTGDPSLLNRKEGFYADLTGMPNNLLDAQNKVLSAFKMYDNLKPEIKEHFGGTIKGFLDGINTSEGVKYLTDFATVKRASSSVESEANNANK